MHRYFNPSTAASPAFRAQAQPQPGGFSAQPQMDTRKRPEPPPPPKGGGNVRVPITNPARGIERSIARRATYDAQIERLRQQANHRGMQANPLSDLSCYFDRLGPSTYAHCCHRWGKGTTCIPVQGKSGPQR